MSHAPLDSEVPFGECSYICHLLVLRKCFNKVYCVKFWFVESLGHDICNILFHIHVVHFYDSSVVALRH